VHRILNGLSCLRSLIAFAIAAFIAVVVLVAWSLLWLPQIVARPSAFNSAQPDRRIGIFCHRFSLQSLLLFTILLRSFTFANLRKHATH
jgi:hypothetical protein